MKIQSLLSAYSGRIYVYLATLELSRQFLQDAEAEGFTFCDGALPTRKPVSDLFALNRDKTIQYVGFVGRVAYQSARQLGGEPLVKIDYRDLLNQPER